MSIADYFQGLLLQSPFSDNKGSWKHHDVPPMRLKRHGCAAATLNDDTIVVMGGHDGVSETECVEIYKGGSWSAGASLKTRRLGSVAATVQTTSTINNRNNNECILAVGGHDGQAVLSSTERYQLRLDMWTESDFLPYGGLFNAAAVAIQKRLYVMGGHDGKSPQNQMFVFDPDFCTWTAAPTMLQERFCFGAAILGKYIYIVGGDSNNDGALQSMERYDTQNRTWSSLPPMSCKRKGCVAAGVGGYVYVFGGHDGRQVLSSCERYDPVSESWSRLPPMSCKRFGSAVAVLGNRIFIIGGFDGKAAMDTVEQFTVPSINQEVAREENNDDTPILIATQCQSANDDPREDPPDELQCPITGDLMIDPVVASDGHSYEREAIEEWIRRFPPASMPRSPSTNEPIRRNIFPNHNLKSLCREYASSNRMW